MDPEFVSAIASVAGGGKLNVSKFCREYRISRTTFGKYVDRFSAEGAAGLTPRSRTPHTSPMKTSARVCELIIRARKELDDDGLDNGPISVRWKLEDDGVLPLPSRATVYRILRQHGQVVLQPQKAPKCTHSFVYPAPNDLWQMDGTDFTLAGGKVVCVLQILDDHSRLDMGSLAVPTENGRDIHRALELAFEGYGEPARTLFDNGLGFSARHRGGASPVERSLAARGIQPITSSIRHPQTCGKNERVHQTLAKWLGKRPVPATIEELQVLIEQYRIVYNNRRHQSLGGRTPTQVYAETPCGGPSLEPILLAGVANRPVSSTGALRFDACIISLGRKWANTSATLHWRGDEVTVMVGDLIARTLTLDRAVVFQRLTPKLSTKS